MPDQEATNPEGSDDAVIVRKSYPIDSIQNISMILLWILTITSLLLNLIIINQLLRIRSVARQGVRDAIIVLEGLQGERFEYTVVVDEVIELDTDLPIDETIPVQIRETLPINTTVSVPLETPFGTLPVDVPIRTTIPINLDVPVRINQTFDIRADIPIYFEQPISLALEDTPLMSSIDDVQARLIALEMDLSRPLIPLGGNGQAGAGEEAITVTATP